MSLDLSSVNDHLKALLARDRECAAIPFLTQIAGTEDEEADAAKYNDFLESALADPGVAFVAVAAEGELAGSEAQNDLDLWNTVVLSIAENKKKNRTGVTAYQFLRRVLRLCHRGQTSGVRGARPDVKLGRPAWNLGPFGHGKVVYFVNLLVRTTEDLGPLTPV